MGNFCFEDYLGEINRQANEEFGENAPHCIHTDK
jgi:hypothetical protein